MKFYCHNLIFGIFFLIAFSVNAQHLEIQGRVEGPPQTDWENGFVFLSGALPLLPLWNVTTPAVLDQKDFQFSPKVLAVVPGQDLKIKNSDQELHNVHGYGEDGMTRFNLPVIAGMKTTLRIEKVEVLDIFCDIHAQMRAYILCLENPYFARLTAEGSFHLKSIPDQAKTISFWHPYLEPRTLEISGESPLVFKTGWRTGFQPKEKSETLPFKVYSFQEISQEIANRLQEVSILPKEQSFSVIDDCYFTLYEAGGMETAVRFHLSGRRAFVHEQGFRDIKTALRESSQEQCLKRIEALSLDLKAASEELQSLGIENRPEFSTGSIQFSQKPKRNEYLAQTTTRKLVTLFQETDDLTIAETILTICQERSTPYLDRFLPKFSEYPIKKQILLLKHLKHFVNNAQTRALLLECLQKESWLLRATALEVLRFYPEVESIFRGCLTDASSVVQQKAVHGLVYQGGKNCLTIAEPYLTQENPDLRLAAVYGLMEITQQLKEVAVTETIQNRLLQLGEDAENRPDIRQEVWTFLGSKSQHQWKKAFSEENPHIREAILYVVVHHNYELAFFLREGLCDPETRVRLTALLLLSRIPDHGAILERISRWVLMCQEDKEMNVQSLAKSFSVTLKKDDALADLQLFFSAYDSGYLRTAYFFLSAQEQSITSFSQFSRSYWRNPQLKHLFTNASVEVLEIESERVSVQVKLGGPSGVSPVFFILKKDGLFWKITKK